MVIPIIMIIFIISMGSFFTFTQESPPTGMTLEELAEKNPGSEQVSQLNTETQSESAGTEPAIETKSEEEQTSENVDTTSELNNTQEATSDTLTLESQVIPVETNAMNNVKSNQDIATGDVEATPQEEATENIPTTATPISPSELSSTPETSLPAELTPISEPILEEEATIPEETVAEEPIGIDTVSLENPQGNWLFKRIWWERAEERYEKIRLMVDSIWESRNKFFYERNQLDRNVLDPFYINIGIDRGELQIMLSEIKDFIDKQREEEDNLTEQERMLLSEEERLKQLKIDVDMITSLDHAIDDALGTFMNQINRVRNYEADAWKNFKEIAHILNDAKARELYYMIEGAARNIKTISTYLEQEFFTHFHKLIQDAKSRVTRVQNQMDALKEKGVTFQRQTEQQEEQNNQNKKEEENEEDDEDEVTKPKTHTGWFGWISSGISKTFHYIWAIIRLPYDLIFGKK